MKLVPIVTEEKVPKLYLGFKTNQVIEQTGCTMHQLRYWDKINLVRPSIQETGYRPGRPRIYSEIDIAKLKEIKALLDKGFSLQEIRKPKNLKKLISTVQGAI
jgi:DNA-binding transcriptional MerR regulator